MKIQFVKDYGRYKVGDIHETVSRKAEELIRLGFAKKAGPQTRIEKADAPAPEENADGPQAEKSGQDRSRFNGEETPSEKRKPDALQSKTSGK